MTSRSIVIEECVPLDRYWDNVKKRHRSTELILLLISQYEAGDKIYPDKLALKYMNDPEYDKDANPFQCQVSVRNLLARLGTLGLVRKYGSGRRGDPYYYERATAKQTIEQEVHEPEQRNDVTGAEVTALEAKLKSIEARMLKLEQGQVYIQAMLRGLCDSLGIAERSE